MTKSVSSKSTEDTTYHQSGSWPQSQERYLPWSLWISLTYLLSGIDVEPWYHTTSTDEMEVSLVTDVGQAFRLDQIRVGVDGKGYV